MSGPDLISARPVSHHSGSLSETGDQGEVMAPAEPDLELAEATTRAVRAMNYLALCAIIDGLNPAPGPNYGPGDYGEMTGALTCRVCTRPIRCHRVSEFCI